MIRYALFLLALAAFVLPSLTGCSTTAGTIALTAAGAGGAYVVGNTVATFSELDIEVEAFDHTQLPKKYQRDFEHGTPALYQSMPDRVIDPVLNPTRQAIQDVVEEQLPLPMRQLGAINKTLIESKESIEILNKDGGNNDEDEDSEEVQERDLFLRNTIEDLGILIDNNQNVINKWSILQRNYYAAIRSPEGLSVSKLKSLAFDILSFRQAIDARDGYRLRSDGLLGLIRMELQVGAFNAIGESGPDDGGLLATQYFLDQEFSADDPSRSNEERLATSLLEVIDQLKSTLAPYNIDPQLAVEPLAEALQRYAGIEVTPSDLAMLWRAPLSDDTKIIATELLESRNTINDAIQKRRQAYKATYATIAVDFNFGPIRNELLQAMLTPDAIRHVVNKDNESYWQDFSHARSRGNAGNHDVIIYFENLGLPILKSSAFDPTQFQVANGLMFRKAFGAVAEVYGVSKAPADGDEASSKPPVNLYEMRNDRLKADSTAQQKQRALSRALATTIAQADAAIDAKPQDQPALLAGLKSQIVRKLKSAAASLNPEVTRHGEEEKEGE